MRWLILAPLEKKSCQGFFYQKTFSYLIELGHEIVGYVADKPLKTSPVFSDSIYINNLIFYSETELNYEFQKDKESNCIDEVEKYLRNAEFLHTYLRITDRMMAKPQSAGFRLRMFRLTISYWINLLNKHSIDTVFFESTPHFGFDTLLAMICYEKKVKVLYSARTEFDGMYFIRENWKSLMVLKRVKKYSLVIDSLLQNANWIKYSRNLVDESLLHNKQLDDSCIYVFKDKVIFYLKLFKRTIDILLKIISYRSIESFSFMSKINYIDYISLLLKRKNQSRQQWNSYKKLSSSFDLPENYANGNLKVSIAVNNNDLLICGYNPVNFEIQTNPLWDGELGPYDITGHSPTGGEMGNGSLIILAGQTVTFDAMYVIDQSILPAQLAHLVTYLDNQQLLPPNCKPEHFDALPSFTWQEKLSQSPLTAEKARTRIGDAQSFHFVRQTMLQKYKDNPAFIEWANKN